MTESWQVNFWGVRGSTPQSGPDFVKVGGHTSCVSVLVNKSLYIFDAGTGLIDCGQWILSQEKPEKIYLFLSHAHLDHITGLPFFAPLWLKDWELHIFAASLAPYGGLQNILSRIFAPPYFPVSWSQVPSKIHLTDLDISESLHLLDHMIVETIELNHPGGSSGYRMKHGDLSLAYITDSAPMPEPEGLINFVKGVDLLIYDATFTDKALQEKPDWGHSTWREGTKLAIQANVKQLALFHHDPLHTDTMMQATEIEAQAKFANTFVAKQGMSLLLPAPIRP
jgi:phosphoribosyl 1,2-cyclic phosphodiesterase